MPATNISLLERTSAIGEVPVGSTRLSMVSSGAWRSPDVLHRQPRSPGAWPSDAGAAKPPGDPPAANTQEPGLGRLHDIADRSRQPGGWRCAMSPGGYGAHRDSRHHAQHAPRERRHPAARSEHELQSATGLDAAGLDAERTEADLEIGLHTAEHVPSRTGSASVQRRVIETPALAPKPSPFVLPAVSGPASPT